MEWKEIDGKKALIFDEMPSLLFVTQDGTFASSKVFLDGEFDSLAYQFKIQGESGRFVTYESSRYAISKDDEVFK